MKRKNVEGKTLVITLHIIVLVICFHWPLGRLPWQQHTAGQLVVTLPSCAFPGAPMMKTTSSEGERSPLMRWLLHFSRKSSSLSCSLHLRALSSCLINSAFSRLFDRAAALFDYPNWPGGPCKPRESISRKSRCPVRAHEEAPA